MPSNTLTDASPRTGRPHRALVADDNDANRLVAGRMLTLLGYEVEVAHDGCEAVRLVETQHFDLVLMDCHMPVLDGHAATNLIRKTETGRRVPIIAMTASVMASDRQAAEAAGMDDFLPKPVSLQELRTIAARWTVPGAEVEGSSGPAAPQDTEASAVAVLDHARLAELRQFYPAELLPGLLQTFRRQGRERLDQAVQAHATGDMTALREAAHALRGSTASLGALRLSQLLASIEGAANADTPDLDRLCGQLEREWVTAADALSGIMA